MPAGIVVKLLSWHSCLSAFADHDRKVIGNVDKLAGAVFINIFAIMPRVTSLRIGEVLFLPIPPSCLT